MSEPTPTANPTPASRGDGAEPEARATATSDTPGAQGDLPQSGPILVAERLAKEYDGGQIVALAGVDLAVARGEFLAIVGPSGSGKSTLLHLLGSLDTPTRGRVLIGGRDVSTVRRLNVLRAEALGFIFQLHNLIPSLTLLDNVMVPMAPLKRPGADKRAHAVEALARVGLGHRMHHVPTKVSGGERQRAAFARALVNNPAIVLADEPTGNVDSKTGDGLLDLLEDHRRERQTTLVVVTHNPLVAERADRVILITDGRLLQGRDVKDWLRPLAHRAPV